jgi:diaminopimelate decarboxylase
MKYLSYKNVKNRDELFIENVSVISIAASVGTPFYAYSKKTLVENYQNFVDAFVSAEISDYKICYAIKANYNIHLVKILSGLGAGIDAVSAGEVFRAIKANVDAKKIVFAGVGKTREEIKFALENGVEEFSVESIAEMYMLNEVAGALNKKAKFSLRVNPNVDAKTIDKISTGRKGDKFGVDIAEAQEVYYQAAKLPNLQRRSVFAHQLPSFSQFYPLPQHPYVPAGSIAV